MEPVLEQAVEAMLAVDLSGLDQVALQERARRLRLLGGVDQVLAELDSRGDGSVQSNVGSEFAPLYQSVQGWWRDNATLTGQQAARDLRRAVVLRELPLIGQAVIDGVLAPEQAAVLCRLHGTISLTPLLESQVSLIEVARERNTDALGEFVRHLIATSLRDSAVSDSRSAASGRG